MLKAIFLYLAVTLVSLSVLLGLLALTGIEADPAYFLALILYFAFGVYFVFGVMGAKSQHPENNASLKGVALNIWWAAWWPWFFWNRWIK